MHAPAAGLLHQPGPLQGQLHPGIAQGNALFLPQLLVEMAHIEIEILLSIQSEHPFGQLQRHTPRAGTTPAPIQQSVIAELLPAAAPAPHLPVADADHPAACHQVMRLAIARRITSCTFIARSTTASGITLRPSSGRELYRKLV